MSDSQIGHANVTIPDLLEPVVGFRTFRINYQEAREAYDQVIPERVELIRHPKRPPAVFVEPKAFVTCPVTGKLIPNYTVIAEAFVKWQMSMKERVEEIVHPEQVIHHGAQSGYGPYLESPHYSHHWKSGVQEAVCKKAYGPYGPHIAPYPDCTCGFYSYYDNKCPHPDSHTAVGIVTQWGQIEAHEKGMRSQFMKIECLAGQDLAKRVADEWEIPFIRYKPGGTSIPDLLKDVVHDYGSPLPVAMRPKAGVTLHERYIKQGSKIMYPDGTIAYHTFGPHFATHAYALDEQRQRHRKFMRLCYASSVLGSMFGAYAVVHLL